MTKTRADISSIRVFALGSHIKFNALEQNSFGLTIILLSKSLLQLYRMNLIIYTIQDIRIVLIFKFWKSKILYMT